MFEGPPPEPGQLCEGEDSEWNVSFVLVCKCVCVLSGIGEEGETYVSAWFNDFCVPNCK